MISFILGCIAGSISTVVSPKAFRYVAGKVADAKARWKDVAP
jgi:hypothetical protein